MELTKDQKDSFEKWLIENIDETIVPSDEGNVDAMIFNLVHLVRGDGEKYDYKPHQDKELELWGFEI